LTKICAQKRFYHFIPRPWPFNFSPQICSPSCQAQWLH